MIKASDAKATLSFNPPASIVEQDTTFNFVVTLDKPQAADIHIDRSQTGGTAEEGTDFDFSHDIVIPAYSTSAAGELKIYGDDEIEETETFTLSIGDNRTANVNYTSQSFTVELLNAVQPKLDLTLIGRRSYGRWSSRRIV
ncbi:MAG: hypothetical protein IPL35_13510 [Sphingobacteriales bacterium]|nr:hypothetical protein [Sphingobacteriales bacterium]